MPTYTNRTVIVLPHAEEYRKRYRVSVDEILLLLNDPEEREGLATDHYTAKRTFETRLVFLDYYVTLPLQGDKDSVFAIVDFVGVEQDEMLPN